jgi:hypothetical protein
MRFSNITSHGVSSAQVTYGIDVGLKWQLHGELMTCEILRLLVKIKNGTRVNKVA